MLWSHEIFLVLVWSTTVFGLICHCDYYCPVTHNNTFTCETNYKCFTIRRYGSDKAQHGCMPPQHGVGTFQCRRTAPHKVPMTILCCEEKDRCNLNLHPTPSPQEVETYKREMQLKGRKPLRNNNHGIALVISITISVMLLVIVVTYLYLRFRQITAKRKQDSERKVYVYHGRESISPVGELLGRSSGTGAGVPVLTQRTIAKEITLYHEIGRGRFGTVFKGRWKQQSVAVKIVDARDELSWQREQDLYQTSYLCHENILGFVAADIRIGENQEVQRLLITAYHSHGSLHDFLQMHSFDYRILYRLAFSAISGLWYIHRVITGCHGKPPIAHRDIKSKNILVKENLQCCISDFGLAIKYDSETKEIDFGNNYRLPTIRYMSPEILESRGNINSYSFDTYQKADIFAFGLVLWEITRRYEVDGDPEVYLLPYYFEVGDSPSEAEMFDIVCRKQIKLGLPARYEEDQHAKALMKLMNECWHYSPSARLTSLRVKKTLQKCMEDQCYEDSRGISIGGHTNSTGIS